MDALMGHLQRFADKVLGNLCGVLVAWQVCAIVLTTAGTLCTLIAMDYVETIPLLMLSESYFLIFIFNVWWWPKSDVSWWKYCLIAICGLLGDWTGVMAYNLTSLASAMLLNTTVIFWVAPLSFFVFKRKINWKQLIAILIAAAGVSMVMVSDGVEGSKWLGNVVSLCSAICYAISTVTQEKVVNDASVRLYLCRFSVCACPLALALSGAIEWKTIRDYNWTTESVLLQLGYAVLLAIYYTLVPIILQYSNATVMNLSALTGNFYSLAISIFAFGSQAEWLYLLGFVCIPIAIAVFTLTEDKDKFEELPESVAQTDPEAVEAMKEDQLEEVEEPVLEKDDPDQ